MATYDESFRQNIVILPVEKYLIRIVSTFILAGGFKPSKKNQSTGVIIPNKWKIKNMFQSPPTSYRSNHY